MSESRDWGESRGVAPVTPSYYDDGESRNCGESRDFESISSYPTSSLNVRKSNSIEESKQPVLSQFSGVQYNNLDDIDRLIEQLERNLPNTDLNSTRYNQALAKRKKQIAELKQLRNEAKRQAEEDIKSRQLEKENDEIDDIIGNVKKYLLKKETKPVNNTNYSYPYYDPGESRDSGESRW